MTENHGRLLGLFDSVLCRRILNISSSGSAELFDNSTDGTRRNDKSGSSHPERILVVDDDRMVRDTIARYLLRQGYQIETADDGIQALQKLENTEYDLVLTDLTMPNLDGRELLIHLADRYPNLPRVVLTGDGSSEDVILALKTGAYDFLTKPIVDFIFLLNSVERALEKKRFRDERKRYIEQITQINELISLLNRGKDTGEIFNALNTTLKKIIPFNRLALIMHATPKKAVLRMVESDGEIRLGVGEAFPLEASLLGEVDKIRKALIVNNLIEYQQKNPDSRHSRLLIEEGIQSSLTLPLIINNETRGALVFASRHTDFFEQEHIIFLESIVGHISLSIQRGELLNALEKHTRNLEVLVQQRSKEVIDTRRTTIYALSKLADVRDTETGEHLDRIRRYCVLTAQLLKYSASSDEQNVGREINNIYIRDLYDSSILHDIGKVGIPDSILMKPGPLTPEEYSIIKSHTTLGYKALAEASRNLGEDSFLKMALDIILYHHERWDGQGYPAGLEGSEIPLSARIVSICDVYDALTSKRPYKEAYSHERGIEIMTAEGDGHFDPIIFKLFLENAIEFERIRKELS